MNKAMSFSDCLKELLLIKGWSAAQLSREISVDASYIRRWIRGERIPPLKSNYIPLISACLCKESENEIMIKLKKIYTEINDNEPVKNIVEQMLKNAQINSLLGNQIGYENTMRENEITDILEQFETGYPIKKSTEDKNSFTYAKRDIPSQINGISALQNAALAILSEAIQNRSITQGNIFITFQSRMNFLNDDLNFNRQWRYLVLQALKIGWKIHYMFRLSRDINRSLAHVNEIISWAGYKNGFFPTYFTQYGITTPPLEIVAVSGIGALFCLGEERTVDHAFFFKDHEEINLLLNYSEKLFSQTIPLLRNLTPREKYFVFITEKDRCAGDFFCTCCDLYPTTITLPLWKKYLKRSLKDDEIIKPHITRLSERIRLFHESLINFKVKQIYWASLIEYIVKNADYPYSNFFQIPEPRDILQHLQHLVYLLRTYKNYEIAFLCKEQSSLIPPVNWEVKGRHNVVITTIEAGENHNLLDTAITEETVAGAFSDYFLYVWQRIDLRYREKKHVILWLEEKIRIFRNNFSITD